MDLATNENAKRSEVETITDIVIHATYLRLKIDGSGIAELGVDVQIGAQGLSFLAPRQLLLFIISISSVFQLEEVLSARYFIAGLLKRLNYS